MGEKPPEKGKNTCYSQIFVSEIKEFREDDFSDLKILGEGGQAYVYSAYSTKFGQER